MIEKMAQRLSRIIDSYKIPIQLKVSIKKTIQNEVSNLCAETADTIRMIDIYTLIDKFDFTTDDGKISAFCYRVPPSIDLNL